MTLLLCLAVIFFAIPCRPCQPVTDYKSATQSHHGDHSGSPAPEVITVTNEPTEPSDAPSYFKRRKPEQASIVYRSAPKPAWVAHAVLKLIALSNKGCRTVANLFNQKHAQTGITLGKTYVAELRKNSQYLLFQIRHQIRNQTPYPMQPNQEWAIDYTELRINKQRFSIIAIVDCGSRRVLQLSRSDQSVGTLISKLTTLFGPHGKPNTIRTDNGPSFTSKVFEEYLNDRGIEHKLSTPFAPWENGKIERFNRTFKEAIRQIQIDSETRLDRALTEFAFYYNHIRAHQSLDGRTPMMVWKNEWKFPKRDCVWYSTWDGVLCGWLFPDQKPAVQNDS